MNTIALQQEVLLPTSSTLAQTQLCPLNKQPTATNREGEDLEKACWNGWVQEMLPELVLHTPSGRPLYLWQVRKGRCCLQLQLGEFPFSLDKACSIDPLLFLTALLLN